MILPSALLFGLTQLPDVVSASQSVKVAIIGAGAGGSSASYWLSLAKQRSAPNANLSVTVYEKDNRVGGRSTTVYPYNDTSYAPIELGASIFTTGNRNMVRAASELGFPLVQFDAVVPGTGIWDGKQFVWRTTDNSTADNIRMAERYQTGPQVSGVLINEFSNTNFSRSYTPTFSQWQNISAYSASLGYTSLQTQTLQDYLESNGVNKLWTQEFMSGSSRFNYGQDADAIDAVAGMASLAASTANSAKPGNFKIFEGLLAKSGATLKLGSEVTSVTKVAEKYLITTKNSVATYDSVIIAAPLPLTTIKFFNLPQPSTFPQVNYVHLHVTLFTTTTPSLLHTYFKLNDTLALPGTVLTTAESGIQPEFNSIRYQANITRNGVTEYIVKMFSKATITDETLATLFGKGTIGWIYRKEWDAYPYFPTRTAFPPVKIDKGLYYVNAMEGLWSTMETETISSRNVVDLLSTEIWGSGLCGPGGAKGPFSETYAVGWDC